MATSSRVKPIETAVLSERFRLVSNRRSILRRMALLAMWAPMAPPLVAGATDAEVPGSKLFNDSSERFSGPSQQCSSLWVLNTRGLSSNACRIDLEEPQLCVSRREGTGHFVPSDIQQFVDDVRARPDIPTVIYAHGNRFTHKAAIDRAWLVYRQITSHRCESRPLRFVLWSWPSEQIGLALKDVRVKADRTDAQGLYMAWVLRELVPTQTPMTLIGYSFGGRVVTGALHALAGGSLAGRELPGPSVVGANVSVGLIAAAIEESWLIPGDYHGRATKNIDNISLMYNPKDKVLKRYWLLECDEFVKAVGVVGRLRLGPRADGSPVEVRSYNCSTTVGPKHDELDYFSRECRGGAILARLIPNPSPKSPVHSPGAPAVSQGVVEQSRTSVDW